MSSWVTSEQCLSKHSHYLDKILEGTLMFQHEHPMSLASVIRGMLRRIRLVGDERYKELVNYTVRVKYDTVFVTPKPPPTKVDKFYRGRSLSGILLGIQKMARPYGKRLCMFTRTELSEEDVEAIRNICQELGFILEIEDEYIKVAKT